VRIVRQITGADERRALAALESNAWVVRNACAALGGLK
jgi:hypothetical protein